MGSDLNQSSKGDNFAGEDKLGTKVDVDTEVVVGTEVLVGIEVAVGTGLVAGMVVDTEVVTDIGAGVGMTGLDTGNFGGDGSFGGDSNAAAASMTALKARPSTDFDRRRRAIVAGSETGTFAAFLNDWERVKGSRVGRPLLGDPFRGVVGELLPMESNAEKSKLRSSSGSCSRSSVADGRIGDQEDVVSVKDPAGESGGDC